MVIGFLYPGFEKTAKAAKLYRFARELQPARSQAQLFKCQRSSSPPVIADHHLPDAEQVHCHGNRAGSRASTSSFPAGHLDLAGSVVVDNYLDVNRSSLIAGCAEMNPGFGYQTINT
jgi:hypothetical protein